MLPFLPLPLFGTVNICDSQKNNVLNQLIAGSIMVRHMILALVLSLPLRVYYLIRCTHNALWGVIMNSFDSTISYFCCVSFFDKICMIRLLGGMCIPLQYFTDCIVLRDLSG